MRMSQNMLFRAPELAVDLTAEGDVQLGTVMVDVGVARGLLTDLQRVVGDAEQRRESAEWTRLRDWLDAHFAGAYPAEGRDNSGHRVQGLLRRETEDVASFRVGSFHVARVRIRGKEAKEWEGLVYRYTPDALLGHIVHATKRRVRVQSTSVLTAPKVDALLGRIPVNRLGGA